MKEEIKQPTPIPRETALAAAEAILVTYEAAFRELVK
jgi:hypothetical protein